ncbi:MAG: hypothetical protein ACE5JB_03840 [bacterium]
MPLLYKGQKYPTHYYMILWKDAHITYSAETSIGNGKYDRIITDSGNLDEMISKQKLSLKIALESRKVRYRIAQNHK